jgi:plastocyanin
MAGNGGSRRVLLAAVLALVAALLLVGIVRWRADREPPALRTVVLSMRDYTFNGDNPTLSFHEGERVRFVVRNDETTSIRHNFAIPMLNVPCDRELGPGEIRHVILTLARPGTYEYLCCTHRGMGGKLVVTGR